MADKKRQPLIDFLAIMFGIGAWISINGAWVELPLLVKSLPEGWNLPSYMSVIIQIANVGPVAYSLIRTFCPSKSREVIVIYVVMFVGVLASLLLPLLWEQTAIIGGVEHSLALLALLFCLSLVDCTSSVLFLPFMARFRDVYLTSYLVGEGLSGFLPSIVALAQGVGGNPECRNTTEPRFSNLSGETELVFKLEPFYPEPRFSTREFFFILFAMMVCSALAFILLNHLPLAKEERVGRYQKRRHHDNQPITSNVTSSAMSTLPNYSSAASANSLSSRESSPSAAASQESHTVPLRSGRDTETVGESSMLQSVKPLKKSIFFYLLAVQAWVCALSNGVLPSIQSYSCLPYGNTAYHLAVTLSSMANPLACSIAFFLPSTSIVLITALTAVGTLLSCYILALAALSPLPPLIGTVTGEALMVTAWVLFVAFFSYVKVGIASVLRNQPETAGRNLFWCGAVTQIGSAIGAITTFVLVNVYYLFQAYYPCT